MRPAQFACCLHTFAYPGWNLTVDGQPRPLVASSREDLVAVDLESGSHDVWLRFGPTPLRAASALVSAFTAVLVLWLVSGLPYIQRRTAMQPAGRHLRQPMQNT
jgi:hypothetical protein